MFELTDKKQRLWACFNRYHLMAWVVFICFLITTIGNTQDNQHTIQINFSFDTQAIPGRQVVGYRVYMEDESICAVGPVDPQIITCSFIADPGNYAFSLSAIYNRGADSRPSNRFTVSIGDMVNIQPGDINGDGFIDLRDIITGLQVLINSSSSNITIEADVNGDNKIGFEEILFDLNQTSLN